MSEADRTAKMLRAVLQSNKNGVALPLLQSEYKSLTGEWIPFNQLGYPTLEEYLKSIPSVVKLTVSSGETICIAMTCKETEDIAQLVARQRDSKKKTGQNDKYQKKIKEPAALFMPRGEPKKSLRKPEFYGEAEKYYRKSGLKEKNRFGISPYMAPPVFGHEDAKCYSVQSNVYMFQHNRKSMVNKTFLNYHFLCFKGTIRENVFEGTLLPPGSSMYKIDEVQYRIKELLSMHSNGILLTGIPQLYKEYYKEELNKDVLQHMLHWHHICKVENRKYGGQNNIFIHPAEKIPQWKGGRDPERPVHPQTSSPKPNDHPSALEDDFKEKVAQLLAKYSNGVWASSLPEMYEEAYKVKFPEHALQSLNSLTDICIVDCTTGNPQKAVLHYKAIKTSQDTQSASLTLENSSNTMVVKRTQQGRMGHMVSKNIPVPPLVIPTDSCSPVLVVKLNNTNEVLIRYIGKNYSASQELMENEMQEFYGKNKIKSMPHLQNGQLVAVNTKHDKYLRAQITSIHNFRVKIYYVDFGFADTIDKCQIYILHPKFYSLAFQAARCKLAGLEHFSNHPALLKMFESQICGKIVVAEILENVDIPPVVLYDTSGEEDVNINALCLKELYDKTLKYPLKENLTYENVRVTNINADGILFLQVPCQGLSKLNTIMNKLEIHLKDEVGFQFTHVICQMSASEKLIKPVKITNTHKTQAVDVHFLDTGKVASVLVTDLRDIPELFVRELIQIPPQALKCCLSDIKLTNKMWTEEAVTWLKEMVLDRPDIRIKVMKLDEPKGIIHIYLFVSKLSVKFQGSIKCQVIAEDIWKHQCDSSLGVTSSENIAKNDQSDNSTKSGLASRPNLPDPVIMPVSNPQMKSSAVHLPPCISLPKPGEYVDIFISVACHPGHFVIQLLKEVPKLKALMEEMIQFYSKTGEISIQFEQGALYAAQVRNKWYRVILKRYMKNELISVYELDYGKHELVSIRKVQPLINKFRELPFQAITAQLAGVKHDKWTEETSVLFRCHVENKSMSALVEVSDESKTSLEQKLVVFLIERSQSGDEIWIHDLMLESDRETKKARKP
uniref:Tudor domain-containing protein 7 n=1 Tax=Ornithorhynchus anatinus TaxID=9258 RepID=F6TDA9_ORNAN